MPSCRTWPWFLLFRISCITFCPENQAAFRRGFPYNSRNSSLAASSRFLRQQDNTWPSILRSRVHLTYRRRSNVLTILSRSRIASTKNRRVIQSWAIAVPERVREARLSQQQTLLGIENVTNPRSGVYFA